MSCKEKADPDLPEAPRDGEGNYRLSPGFKFCVKITNSSTHHLHVMLFNASAGGKVEYLSKSDAVLRDGAADVMWLDGYLGEAFAANPDRLPRAVPGITLPEHTTDRLVAIGTTRDNVDLGHLTVDKQVQDVINENLMRDGERSVRPEKAAEAPTELWTATVVPVRIVRQ